MARSEIDTVKLWIANHTGRPYEEYDENTVMVDTDYCGLYPSREALAVQAKIKAYIRRHHPSIHVESRGCYTGLLIEAQKEAARRASTERQKGEQEMNDIGYIDLEFKGSEAEVTVKGLSAESLKYRRRYTEMAVEYHKREQNPKQVIFFEAELKLIDKRLRRLNKKAALAR